MSTIEGKIASKSRPGTGVKIGDTWYNGTKSILDAVAWKDEVTLTLDAEGKVIKAEKKAGATTNSGSSGGKSGWTDTQPAIAFRWAYSHAHDVLRTALETKAIKLPAKETDILCVLEEFINMYALKAYERALAVHQGTPADVAIFGEEGGEE